MAETNLKNSLKHVELVNIECLKVKLNEEIRIFIPFNGYQIF
jgi:hypothetical protein